MRSCCSTCSQSKCLTVWMDQARPADEQVKWPGSKGSVGLQGPALGRSGSLSRTAGVGGSGDPGSPGQHWERVRMHMEVRLSAPQWGCCPMSSYLQAQKLEILGSRGATGQTVSEPTCCRNPHCTYTSLYYLPAQPERGAGWGCHSTHTSCVSAFWSHSATDIYLDNQHWIFSSTKLFATLSGNTLQTHLAVPNHNDWRDCSRKVM